MGWGGARPGSGRKPTVKSPKVKHPKVGGTRAELKVPDRAVAAPAVIASEQQAKIDAERMAVMMRVIAQASAAAQKARDPARNPFKLPDFPKSAIPQDKSLQMAMDESLTWAATQWSGAYMAELANEGLLFLGYPYLSELAQRPEYRVMSETIATEMIRKWITLKGVGEGDKTEKIKELNDYMEQMRVRDKYGELALHDGLFGRAHLFYDFNANDEELKTPIGDGRDGVTKAKVKKNSLKALRTVEPVWVYPTTYNATNPLAHDWYNPQVWYVMGKQIHCSRLPTFVGREVPDLLKPAYSFGGLSLTQLAKPYVDTWLTTRESVGQLIHSFSVMVLMTDLATILQPGNADALMARVAMFNALRDNQGTFVINKNTEDFKNVQASLAGLHELQAQSQEHMMSVARIPAVKFTGIQPAGLNASSEGEMRAFYDTIGAYQNKFFRPKLQTTIDICQISLWGQRDPEIIFDFNPLWELDEKEKAEKKSKEAETDTKYIEAGVISPVEVRTRLANDPDSGYEGLDPDDVPEPPAEEGEGGEPPAGGPDDEAGMEEAEREQTQGAGDEGIIPFADEEDPFAEDGEWKEDDHPRAPDGKFGSGSGKSSGPKQKLKMPQYGLTATPRSSHQHKPDDGSEYFKKNWAKSNSVGGHNQPSPQTVKKYEDAYLNQGKSAPVLDPADLTKVGSQKGSNPGGVYSNAAGEKFYVKKGRSPAHVRNEILAANLYKLAGSPVLDYVPVKGGGHIATKMEKLEKDRVSKLSPEEVKAMQDQFAVHAWLSNYDAAGTGGDNQGVINGVVTTLDVGGSLEYRAQGAPKGDKFGDKVLEFDTMRDPKISPDAAAVFSKMTPEEIKASVQRVAKIPDAEIRKTVEEAGVSDAMADRLIARKKDLAKKVGVIASDADFKEEEHPRDAGGKFTSGAGSSGSQKSESAKKEGAKAEGKMDYGGLWTFEDDPQKEFVTNTKKILQGATKTGNFWRNMVRRLIKDSAKLGALHTDALKLKLGESWAMTAKKLDEAASKETDNAKKGELWKAAEAAWKKADANGFKSESKTPEYSEPEGWPEDLPHTYENFQKLMGVLNAAGKKNPKALESIENLKKFNPKFASQYEGEQHAQKLIAEAEAKKPKTSKEVQAIANMMTPEQLKKAQKNTTLPISSSDPGVVDLIKQFNDKYAGKNITDKVALAQKIIDYKDIIDLKNKVETAAQAKAQAEAQKKAAAQKAAEAEAAKKHAAENASYMKELGLNEMEAEAFSALAGMLGHNQQTAIKSFKQYQEEAKNLGYPITGFQAALIANYSNGGYDSINKALRSGSWTPAQHLYVKQVNKALKAMPTFKGTVTRNTNLVDEDISKYKAGHIIQEHALTSTSTGSVFSGNVQYKIKAIGKRAAHIKKLSHHPGENEVLFAAKTYFKVHTVEKKGGQTVITMEEIADDEL